MKYRSDSIKVAQSWVGLNEKDGSYKKIIDIYNSYKGPLPRGIKMQYFWAWCACTWSAIAIYLGFTDIMPIEISCKYLIDQAMKMGIWKEADDYIPKPGDAVLYDWQDNGKGDNIGWPDHVGMVEYVNKDAGYFTVIEGNYKDSVKKRTVSINGKFIRGFITPKYDEESFVNLGMVGTSKDIHTAALDVIAGVYGTGEARKKALEANGFNYQEVQTEVNRILNGSAVKPKDPVQDPNQPHSKRITSTCYAKRCSSAYLNNYKTTADLYLRNDAGTNKKALCIMPKGTTVHCYGYFNTFKGADWLYVEVVLDGILYTGFCHSKYLNKIVS